MNRRESDTVPIAFHFHSYGPVHTANLGRRWKQACSHMHTLLLASEHVATSAHGMQQNRLPERNLVELHEAPRSCLVDVEVLAQSVQQGLGVLFVPRGLGLWWKDSEGAASRDSTGIMHDQPLDHASRLLNKFLASTCFNPSPRL